MQDKFHLTKEQNIFIAKRSIVDSIWKEAKLEGIAITFPETEEIFYGRTVPGVSVEDTIAVNNLKRGWHFVLENLDFPIDFSMLCQINKIVGSDALVYGAGFIRKVPVSISGTTWKPDMPIESQIREELTEILTMEGSTRRAIHLMLYCMRKQMFIDGNKRTAQLASNQVMIANGAGILSVPVELQLKFREMLIRFYETNNAKEISQFVYDYCIEGIDLQKQQQLDELER